MKNEKFDFKSFINHIVAKILFVFGWILDGCMKILNAVNKTPIENDTERRDIRIKQFAISSVVFYCLCNSIFVFMVKSLANATNRTGVVSTHFMPWDIILPRNFSLLVLEIILSIVVGLGVTIKLHTLYRMKNDTKDIKGDNKFMEDEELENNFYKIPKDNISIAEEAGIIAGESESFYYIEPDTHNAMIVGATRSGKGECFVLPSLRLMAYAKKKISIVVNDMKGELLEQTYEEFKANGYKILVLDLIDTDRSMFWNPLKIIIDEYMKAQKSSEDFSQCSKLVNSFAHCITDDEKSEAVWTDSSRALLSAMIYYFLDRGYETGDMSKVNMFSICNFFNEFGTYNTVVKDESGNERTVNALDEIFTNLPRGCLAKLSYTTSKFSEGETRSSIFTVLSSKLDIFVTDMGIQKLTSKNDIDFQDLINPDQPCIVYMVVPFEEKSRYVIASMFVDQCFMQLIRRSRNEPGGKLRQRVEFMLDEFGQMVLIPEMSTKLNVCAGCNIIFNLFLQDLGQLKRYKDDSDGISGACGIKIYILSLNNKTNKEFSEMIGNETVNYLTFSGHLHGFINQQRESVDKKALLDPTQLSKLPIGTAIIKKMRCEPIKTQITPYHLIDNKPERIARMALPFKQPDLQLDTVIFDLNGIWDNLGLIGNQYRLDKLKTESNKIMDKFYQQYALIEQMKLNGEFVSDEMYKYTQQLQQQASEAEQKVLSYQQEVKKITEFRQKQKRVIFAQAYETNMMNAETETITDYPDDIEENEEQYAYASDENFYSQQDDLPYFNIEQLMYKLNGFVGDDLAEMINEQRYSEARGYIKKIQKRPDIRSNFVSEEWSALERYINDEEFKNASENT